MLSVVTFKWHTEGYRSQFESAHVNAMYNMVTRHYTDPFRMIAITDDPAGIDERITTVPLWNDHAHIPNPSWPAGPSCYRRLKVFSREFEEIAGERFVCLDLDVVVTGDLRPLWNRTEDFLIWHTGVAAIPFCASMFMMTAGAYSRVWEEFDPATSPRLALTTGMKGSDQAWIAYCLGQDLRGWGQAEGVHAYKEHVVRQYNYQLPPWARLVMFTGRPDPWDPVVMRQVPWVRKHYSLCDHRADAVELTV